MRSFSIQPPSFALGPVLGGICLLSMSQAMVISDPHRDLISASHPLQGQMLAEIGASNDPRFEYGIRSTDAATVPEGRTLLCPEAQIQESRS